MRKVTIDVKDLESDTSAKFRDITYQSAEGQTRHARILATDPEDGPGEDETEEPGGPTDPCSLKENPDGSPNGWGTPTGGSGIGGGGGDGALPAHPSAPVETPLDQHPSKTGPCW
jgi:hypothetical protein